MQGFLRLSFLFCCFLPFGCASPDEPPWLRRQYVQLGVDAAGQRIEWNGEKSDFPYPGAELLYGQLLQSSGTHATYLEIGAKAFDVGTAGDLDGIGYRFLLGGRRMFRMDRRIRYSLGGGLSFSSIRFSGLDQDFDIIGPGVYLSTSADYMLNARWALGTELRLHLFRTMSDEANDWTTGADAGVHLQYRF